jgi:hypothetical protein
LGRPHQHDYSRIMHRLGSVVQRIICERGGLPEKKFRLLKSRSLKWQILSLAPLSGVDLSSTTTAPASNPPTRPSSTALGITDTINTVLSESSSRFLHHVGRVGLQLAAGGKPALAGG